MWKSNINSLVPHYAIGRIGFGAPFKNVLCKIYKVDGLDALGTLDPDSREGRHRNRPVELVAEAVATGQEA